MGGHDEHTKNNKRRKWIESTHFSVNLKKIPSEQTKSENPLPAEADTSVLNFSSIYWIYFAKKLCFRESDKNV